MHGGSSSTITGLWKAIFVIGAVRHAGAGLTPSDVAPGTGPRERPLPSAQTKYLGSSFPGLVGPRIPSSVATLASGAVGRGDKAGRVAEPDHSRPCSAQALAPTSLSKSRARLGNLPLIQ